MKSLLQKDFNKKWYFIIIALLVAFKLILCSQQMIYIIPEGSPIDDALMFNAAQSITAGNWLGDYSFIAIGKHMFFAVWLALLNLLHIPYMLGGQILYALASIAVLGAFSVVINKNWLKIFIFAAVLFNPVSWASYNMRVYRDNIFPALCILFFAGIIAVILRYNKPFKRSIGWAVLSGVGLGLAWLTREDGAWLLPFAIAASLFYVGVILFSKTSVCKKTFACLIAVIPFAGLMLCTSIFSLINYNYYGRFIISDFSSSEFADAYGALTRLHTGEPVYFTDGRRSPIPVTRDELEEGAKYSPLLKELLAEFDNSPQYYNAYGNLQAKQLFAGGFHWAVRLAAQNLGYYKDASTAQQYYTLLAAEINTACDAGHIPGALAKRSSTIMRFDNSYIAPTFKEMGASFKMLLFFEDTNARSTEISIAKPEHVELWENYLHNKCGIAAEANTNILYYSPVQHIFAKILNLITVIYRILILPCLAISFWQLCCEIKSIFKAWRKKQHAPMFLFAIIMLGILLSLILRVGMISYIEISSFKIGTYLMYLSSAMPLLIIFSSVGFAKWLDNITLNKA